MAVYRQERVRSLLKRMVSKFVFENISEKNMNITVTKIEASSNFKNAVVYVIIHPVGVFEGPKIKQFEKMGLDKLKKISTPLHKKARETFKMKFIPYFEFKIDEGEKNRERIEDILDRLDG